MSQIIYEIFSSSTVVRNSAEMWAGVEGPAARLILSTVRPEVSIADGGSDSSTSDQQSWTIGVHDFNISRISCVDASCRIANTESGAGWIEADDGVKLTTLNVLARETSDVSWNNSEV